MISGIINNRIIFLIIVAERRQKEALLAAILDEGARCISLAYGRGDAKSNYLWGAIGFTQEENKVLLTCLVLNEKIDEIFEVLTEKFELGKPDRGMAFTVPIERISF